jgi:hypothetical protein
LLVVICAVPGGYQRGGDCCDVEFAGGKTVTFKKGQRSRAKTESKHYISTCDITRDRLIADYANVASWEAVGRIYGVSGGLVHKIVTHKYEPKNRELRRKLGYPVLVQIELITSVPVQDCTQILEVRSCCRCQRPFVPNVPSRRKCYSCSPKR